MIKELILTLLCLTKILAEDQEKCQSKINRLSQDGTISKDSLNRLCPQNPCDDFSKPLNATGPCPSYCRMVHGVCRPKILLLPFRRERDEVLLNYASNAQAHALRITRNLTKQLSSRTTTNSDVTPVNRVQGRLLKARSNPFARSYGSEADAIPSELALHGILNNRLGCASNFPLDCNINFFNTASLYPLLDPPVNVPYCLRIPCSSSNPSLDTDRTGCQANPGCYFDQELSYRRQGLGYPTLPGVPVCHLAIRNTQFLRLAHDFVRKSGQQWNPLYTRCMINQNLDSMESSDPGCHSLKMLNYFGVPLKMTGWKGISREECYLINGCFMSHLGNEQHQCFHPASIDRISIRSGEDPLEDNSESVYLYGQALCRPFNSSSPEVFLKSYHECRQSGCVVDRSINSRALHNQFLNLVLSPKVPSKIRPQFWNKIREGEITPGNWKEELRKLIVRSERARPVSFRPAYFNNENVLSQRIFENLETVKKMIENATSATGSAPGPRNFFSSHVQPPMLSNPLSNPLTLSQYLGFSTGNPLYEIQGNGGNNNNIDRFFPRFSMLASMQGAFAGGDYWSLIDLLYPTIETPSICPYRDYNIPSYPPLKGSFTGCCKKNPCYVPRSQVITQRSGPAAYLNEYSEWSKCSSLCGGGTKTRRRVCQKVKFDNSECFGSTEEEQLCNTQECPYWKSWEAFDPCSKTCGDGTQLRSRSCSNRATTSTNRDCTGPSTESRLCNMGNCPEYGPWGTYSPCACGKGVQSRSRSCINNCAVSSNEETEEKECEKFCGSVVVVNETPCNRIACSKTVTYECQILPGEDHFGDTPHCSTFRREATKTCYEGQCARCKILSSKHPFDCLRHLKYLYQQVLQLG